MLLKGLVLLRTLFLTLYLNRVKRQLFISWVCTHWAAQAAALRLSPSAFQLGSEVCFGNFPLTPSATLTAPLDSPHKLDCCLLKGIQVPKKCTYKELQVLRDVQSLKRTRIVQSKANKTHVVWVPGSWHSFSLQSLHRVTVLVNIHIVIVKEAEIQPGDNF